MHHSTIDLHCHSRASDGELSPGDVVSRASSNGVEMLALTDHDTIQGQNEAFAVAADLPIRMVSGIELSCLWNGYTIHVLGLNFSLDSPVMWAAQERQGVVREARSIEIAERLVKKGLPDVLSLASDKAGGGVLGRPHFAEALVELGAVKNHAEAFKKYLGAGKVGDVKSGWPSLAEVVDWIVSAGGDAVIAHPRKYSMSLTKLRALIDEFGEHGGVGLEVVVSGQKQGEVGLLSDLCHKYKLKASVGSDFHSTKFPWADLGRVPSLPKTVTPVWVEW